MKNRLSNVIRLARIELNITYRFPMLEGLVAIFFFVIVWNTTGGWTAMPFGVGQIDRINIILDGLIPSRIFYGVGVFSSWLAILVPLLAALSIAKPFEDGYMRSLITYPIRRTSVLLNKTLFAILIPAGTLSGAFLFAVVSVYPGFPSVYELSLTLVSLWVTVALQAAVCAVIAVFFKRLSIASLFGIGFWLIVNLFLGSPDVSPLLLSVMNPLRAATEHLRDLPGAASSGDVFLGLVTALGFSISLFIASLYLFKRAEV